MPNKESSFDNAYTRLVEQLRVLPGIGEKTANRLAMTILRSPGDYAVNLAGAIQEAKNRIGFCRFCQDLTEEELCRICRDEQRDTSQLCVVEDPASLIAIEQTGQYRGRYHILHGSLSPMQSIGPKTLRLDQLKNRIRQDTSIEEVILALSSDPEGEATALYLREYLEDLSLRLTRIASGMPVGAHVRYTDPITLSRALFSRHELGD